VNDSETRFDRRRQEFYDDIRRASGSAEQVIFPANFIRSDDQSEKDAFYEAINDLLSEGFVRIEEGMILLEPRPRLSDRSKDAPEDHRSAGRGVREEPFPSSQADSEMAAILALPDIPEPLRSFVTHADFGAGVCIYNRLIVVDDVVHAITYSAMPAIPELPEILPREGVFEAFRRLGHAPTLRREELSVRFPYSEERALLGLSPTLWRVPVIVARGRVSSGEALIEKYVNIMRADRYVISSELALPGATH